jgi:uncharacterized protein YuzE
MTLHISKR